ncbi:hypothetical protein IC762_28775 [Bradyrhizobium genosp. L]|uniref:hypothetical protein n=1 Tax=Bradyrhizobium genosp. L TaxID=83637 RepID=UPI0018A30D1A|nr:hypothetical protein [Bradyrhizobium genosp. L]QPF83657.1 hypothetical protein IC762_28775 [Bradyrhizobium genosp. L]
MDYQRKPKPSPEEKALLAEQRRKDAEAAIAERSRADAAFRANYERLKAERLAREESD